MSAPAAQKRGCRNIAAESEDADVPVIELPPSKATPHNGATNIKGMQRAVYVPYAAPLKTTPVHALQQWL